MCDRGVTHGTFRSGSYESSCSQYVWWPVLDQEIKNYTKSCTSWQIDKQALPRAPLHPWAWPMVARLLSQHEPYSVLQCHQLQQFKCKICESLPLLHLIITTCCNQVLGCHQCYERSVEDEPACPLCRSTTVSILPLKGMEEIYQSLERFVAAGASSSSN